MIRQWFKKMDEFFFQGVNHLKTHPKYQELLSFIESLPDHQSKWINQSLSYLIILLPLSLIISIGIYSNNSQSRYETMKEIHSLLYQINNNIKKINSIQNSTLSQGPFHSEKDFEERLGPVLHQKNILSSHVNFSHFHADHSQPPIIKSSVRINFKELSTKKLSDLLKWIIITQKIKVDHVEAQINPKSSLLKGVLHLVSFFKKEKSSK